MIHHDVIVGLQHHIGAGLGQGFDGFLGNRLFALKDAFVYRAVRRDICGWTTIGDGDVDRVEQHGAGRAIGRRRIDQAAVTHVIAADLDKAAIARNIAAARADRAGKVIGAVGPGLGPGSEVVGVDDEANSHVRSVAGPSSPTQTTLKQLR